ncbi:cytochrome c oxidase subunit II [uncultured Frigoribacterium sp.]|uniref:aa3-type cytochrome oxidase subunit II n=1 Tax=uncultured Frigoribacterium sp. TaxID=335377 RepID=UPI0028D07766|nr:cytochrome c oxidase subunit II [uncultured Frigoribacterium sp.]
MRSNRRLRWAAIPVAAVMALVLAGCTPEQLQGWLPTTAGTTNHVDSIIGLWVTSWIVLLIVGLIVWGLIIWTCIAYRRRKGQTGLPVQLRYNMPIEIFYTVVPLILVLGFFAFTARDQAAIEEPTANPDVKIDVYAKRWAWDFNYIDQQQEDDSVYYQGIQAQELPDGEVDQDQLPVLYLPVGKTVQIDLKSRDVAHSFWIVDFLYKKDTIPGKTNYMYFTPEKEGTFTGKCAELCGEYHSLMLFNVKVVSEGEYEDYLDTLADEGNTGLLGDQYNTNTNQPNNEAPVAAGSDEK